MAQTLDAVGGARTYIDTTDPLPYEQRDVVESDAGDAAQPQDTYVQPEKKPEQKDTAPYQPVTRQIFDLGMKRELVITDKAARAFESWCSIDVDKMDAAELTKSLTDVAAQVYANSQTQPTQNADGTPLSEAQIQQQQQTERFRQLTFGSAQAIETQMIKMSSRMPMYCAAAASGIFGQYGDAKLTSFKLVNNLNIGNGKATLRELKDSETFCGMHVPWINTMQTYLGPTLRIAIEGQEEREDVQKIMSAWTPERRAEYNARLTACENSFNISGPESGEYTITADPKYVCCGAVKMLDPSTECKPSLPSTGVQNQFVNPFTDVTTKPTTAWGAVESLIDSYMNGNMWPEWAGQYTFCKPVAERTWAQSTYSNIKGLGASIAAKLKSIGFTATGIAALAWATLVRGGLGKIGQIGLFKTLDAIFSWKNRGGAKQVGDLVKNVKKKIGKKPPKGPPPAVSGDGGKGPTPTSNRTTSTDPGPAADRSRFNVELDPVFYPNTIPETAGAGMPYETRSLDEWFQSLPQIEIYQGLPQIEIDQELATKIGWASVVAAVGAGLIFGGKYAAKVAPGWTKIVGVGVMAVGGVMLSAVPSKASERKPGSEEFCYIKTPDKCYYSREQYLNEPLQPITNILAAFCNEAQ